MPARADITPAQQRQLDEAAKVAQRRAAAEAEFIEAVVGAAEAGATLAEIGRHIGMSGDGVRKILTRHGYVPRTTWQKTRGKGQDGRSM